MMGKAIVPEATARQAVSFVLGAAAALTVVMLVQYRAPAAGLSRARTHRQFSGWRSSDEQYHRRNGTVRTVHDQAPPVAVAAGDDRHHQEPNTTPKANSTAAVTSDHLPSTDRQEESVNCRLNGQLLIDHPGRGGVPGTGGGGCAGGDGRPDGDHHVREPGVGGARLPAGPLPGELPHRRRHGAAPPARARRVHGPGRARPVPGRAHPLLPLHHAGRPDELHLRQVLRLQRVAGDGVEQAEAPAPDPGARLRLPLHRRGYPMVPGPVQARDGVRRHDRLLRRLLRRPRQPRQLPQHGVLPREAQRSHHRHDEAVARVQGQLPWRQRAAGVQHDQEAAGGGARGPAAVPGPGLHGRVLQLRQGSGEDRDHARQLLRGVEEQDEGSEERAGRLEELYKVAALGEAPGQMDRARRLHQVNACRDEGSD